MYDAIVQLYGHTYQYIHRYVVEDVSFSLVSKDDVDTLLLKNRLVEID